MGFRKRRDCTTNVAKTKALISLAVTAKLICVFVFAYAKIRFSHDAAHIGSNQQRHWLACTDGELICTFVVGICKKQVSHDMDSFLIHMSRTMRKPTFCICKNKGADQLRGYQRLCFRHIDNTTSLLCTPSSLNPSSVIVQPGLCRTWSKTPKTGFLMTGLIFVFTGRTTIYSRPIE